MWMSKKFWPTALLAMAMIQPILSEKDPDKDMKHIKDKKPMEWIESIKPIEGIALSSDERKELSKIWDQSLKTEKKPKQKTKPRIDPLQVFQVQTPVLKSREGMGIGAPLAMVPYNGIPTCTGVYMHHDFANSSGHPFVNDYFPPECDFSRVVANLTVVSKGVQLDRVGIMYLGDIEIWRTSTAEPMEDPGIIWTHWKDLTPFLPLWQKPQKLIFDLGNLVNDQHTGVYTVILTLTFMDHTIETPTAPPADFILPLSARRSSQGQGSAMVFPGNTSNSYLFPRNLDRVVVSISAHGHGDEEFWWRNVPESGKSAFSGHMDNELPALSNYREIRLLIDGKVAGLAWPSPVVLPGAVSPPIHRPMVSIDAFDFREYQIDLSPWIGILANGLEHELSLEVVGLDNIWDLLHPNFRPAPNSWVLTGKVFVWLGQSDVWSLALPPVVFVDSIKFKGGDMEKEPQERAGPDGLTFTHIIKRRFGVSAQIHAPMEAMVPKKWSQKLDAETKGKYSDRGNHQVIESVWLGSNEAESDSLSTYATAYSNRIFMDFDYKRKAKPCTPRIAADLMQELWTSVTGLSVFTNGFEAYEHLVPRHSEGTTLLISRESHGAFCQRDNGAVGIGQGWASQKMTLALLPADQNIKGPFSEGFPILYDRSIIVSQETLIEDLVESFGTIKTKKYEPSFITPYEVGHYATLPLLKISSLPPVKNGVDALGDFFGQELRVLDGPLPRNISEEE